MKKLYCISYWCGTEWIGTDQNGYPTKAKALEIAKTAKAEMSIRAQAKVNAVILKVEY